VAGVTKRDEIAERFVAHVFVRGVMDLERRSGAALLAAETAAVLRCRKFVEPRRRIAPLVARNVVPVILAVSHSLLSM
jgi:hypothetical protein